MAQYVESSVLVSSVSTTMADLSSLGMPLLSVSMRVSCRISKSAARGDDVNRLGESGANGLKQYSVTMFDGFTFAALL